LFVAHKQPLRITNNVHTVSSLASVAFTWSTLRFGFTGPIPSPCEVTVGRVDFWSTGVKSPPGAPTARATSGTKWGPRVMGNGGRVGIFHRMSVIPPLVRCFLSFAKHFCCHYHFCCATTGATRAETGTFRADNSHQYHPRQRIGGALAMC
jgi:hypothetical protein